MHSILIAILILAAVLSADFIRADDELYVWTDEKGIQHFSNTPPPKGTRNVKTLFKEKGNPMGVYSRRKQSPTPRPQLDLQRLIKETERQTRNLLDIREKKKPEHRLLKYAEKLSVIGRLVEENFFSIWMCGILLIGLVWLLILVVKRTKR